MMKEFYINDDGIKLHAKLDMPEGYREGDKCPLALVIHGLTGNMEETHITAVARTFNELGFATLRAELYGHGKSDGAFEEHNLFKWLNNAMSVINYAKNLDFVTDMYVSGHSQGGMTSILLAGAHPELFKAAILLSPAVMIPEGAKSGHMFNIDFDPENIPEYVYVSDTEKVRGDYIRAAQLIDLDGAVSRYKKPVLIVHGDCDEAIPASYSSDLSIRYNDSKLVIIHGDDHCYNYHLDEVLDALRSFMQEVIR